MSATHLTADLGNSTCKLIAWSDDGSIVATASWPARSGLGDEVVLFARRVAGGALAAVSSVGASEIERELVAALTLALDGRVCFAPESGLEIALRMPERVGRDRLYAARGALERLHASAIVVDAGTALTVDALEFPGPRASGTVARFLGGAIAPGPRLLAEALARGAARLELVAPEPGVPALGRDTRSALAAGITIGFRGAARELARRVAEESGLVGAPVVLTGGARPFLLQPSSCFDVRVVEDAELVHRGLLAALISHQAAERAAPRIASPADGQDAR